MNIRSYQDWVDLHWQRALTPEEDVQWEAFLKEHPDHQADWEWDHKVLENVHQLQDAPISNNFTSRVLRSVEHLQPDTMTQEEATRHPGTGWLARWWSLPAIRIAGVSALVLAGFGLWQWDPTSPNLVESVTKVTQSEAVPSLEELENFDAINGLAQTGSDVDWELIFAMD